MNINIKQLHPDFKQPIRIHSTDAGMDLIATEMEITATYVRYKLGFAIQIPEGYMGLIYPRSSISNYNLTLCNSVGVIDGGHLGELEVRFNILPNEQGSKLNAKIYKVGDRVAQLIIMPYPQVDLTLTEDLLDTERGEGGFGSTGKVKEYMSLTASGFAAFFNNTATSL